MLAITYSLALFCIAFVLSAAFDFNFAGVYLDVEATLFIRR